MLTSRVAQAQLTFPKMYPMEPPQFAFLQDMWHPNVFPVPPPHLNCNAFYILVPVPVLATVAPPSTEHAPRRMVKSASRSYTHQERTQCLVKWRANDGAQHRT